jgi:hypothetical protein
LRSPWRRVGATATAAADAAPAPGGAARAAASPRLALSCIAATALLTFASDIARAQVSPGPLAAAHQAFDGSLRCFDCHAKGGSMREKCLACHKEIAWGIESRRGLHARLEKECARCHPDHAGREFDLVHWEEGAAERFDHQRAGYALDGKHAALECRACHKPSLQKSQAASLMKRVQPAESWLGLETACASCHKDPHAGSFGAACAKCHVADSWQRLNQNSFDHDRTRYPLRGRHVSVTCAACHDPVKAWGKKPAFAACGDCHRDAHAGQATLAAKPADCAACHDLKGWTPSTYTVAQHRASDYPLEGRHARVLCASCHRKEPAGPAAAALGPARVRLRPAFERCARCHADAHGGEFARADAPARRRAEPAARAAAGARPETATAHAGAAPGAAGRARGMEPGACESCHGVAGWRPSRVDVAAHSRYDFALDGAHAAVPCFACHKALAVAANSASAQPAAVTASAATPLRFEIREARCETCHEGPHGAQFAKRRDRGACEACHGAERFVPAARFDHGRTAFPLEGAHARAACERCHPSERDGRGGRRVVYRPLSTRCEGCHVTPPTGSLKTFVPDRGPAAPRPLPAHPLS